MLFSQSCSSLESYYSRRTTSSPRAGPSLILSHIILPKSDFCLLPDGFGCFIMAQNCRKKLTQHDPSCSFATMPSSASLRGFANGIRACLDTRFRIAGFVLVTAIRVSMVRGSGAPVSITWQGLHKRSSSSDCLFVIPTHLIWNHLRHFEHPTQKICRWVYNIFERSRTY